MKTLLLLIISMGAFAAANAQQTAKYPYEEMEKTAAAYFKAYGNRNADSMAMYYAEDFRYVDETLAGAGVGATPFDVTGKDIVIDQFKQNFFPVAKKYDWQEESHFFSGDQGVFQGKLEVIYKGTAIGKSDDLNYLWSVSYVIVLTFKDGKIIRQNDYIDYPGSTLTEIK